MTSSVLEKEVLIHRLLAKQELAIRKARRSFWAYCQLKAPDFYKKDRFYLRKICNELQNFYELDEEDTLIINLPPRHGKSRTVGLFVEWVLGYEPKMQVMTGAYNETLSQSFSRSVRDSIMEQKGDPLKIVYSDIFPETRINRNHSSVSLWGLEGGNQYNYLATSPTGTATGFGANLLIIDDLIKNAKEAFNERILNEHWEWYTKTMLSRLEEGGKQIVVMTRWNINDLAGRIQQHYEKEGRKLKIIKMKALQDDGTMLCEEVLSRESYEERVKAIGEEIACANYQQEPKDVKGRLYTSFKTYEDIPRDQDGNPLFERIISYTDTADEGKDYLCSVVAGEYQGEGYILDVLYTKEGMEITEPQTADFLVENGVNVAVFESNNGGRGFSRNVERLIWERHQTRSVNVTWFHQSQNKMARILSNSTFVMNHLYFPVNWRDRWPEYYDAMLSFQREERNENDDAPDATTGIAELISKSRRRKEKASEGRVKASRPKRRGR